MKFVYFGSAYFSCITLENLYAQRFIPALIVTQPDRPKGRGLRLQPTAVSVFACQHDIPVIKPNSLNDNNVLKQLMDCRADFFVVADYGKILPAPIIGVPKVLTIALHPSLLPKYRGCAPINWTLINGELTSGNTVFKMNERVDSGEILLQKELTVENNDDVLSLTEKLAFAGARLLAESIHYIEQGGYCLKPQDERYATFAPKLTKEQGRINWAVPAQAIYNVIRGTLGWPSAYTYYQNKLIKILKAEVCCCEAVNAPFSEIVKIDKSGIYVAAGRDFLKIIKLRPQGKKDMDAYAFVCGNRVCVGDKFS